MKELARITKLGINKDGCIQGEAVVTKNQMKKLVKLGFVSCPLCNGYKKHNKVAGKTYKGKKCPLN